MERQIRCISKYIEEKLAFSAGSRGAVHSVYQKTINISFQGGLASLQAAGSPLSPLSLISFLDPSEMRAMPIAKGDTVAFFDSGFEVEAAGGRESGEGKYSGGGGAAGASGRSDSERYYGGYGEEYPERCSGNRPRKYRFSYADAERYDLELPGEMPPSSRRILAENIACALSGAQSGGFGLIFQQGREKDLPLLLLAAKGRMEQCRALFGEGECPAAAKALAGLVGLGIGLTPSGDDFLCGALAGLCMAGQGEGLFARNLKSEIRQRLSSTVDISAAFLSCALEGSYSLAVNRLCQVPPPSEIADSFSKIGHSSGTDTLCGVLFALRL